jgi:hypothetical protein
MNIYRLYHPFLRYFRKKRMKEFYYAYNLEQAMRVLDVGGDFFNWSFFSAGHSLTIINLYFPEKINGMCLGFLRMGVFFLSKKVHSM